MSKTTPINTGVPAGGESPRLGDDRIRAQAAGIVELMQVDHYMGTPTGTAYDSDDAGKHVKVTFRESQTVKPSIGTDKGMLYLKGETPELFYEDSAGNETQLTDQGKIPFTSLNNLANDTYLKAKDPAGTGTVDLIKAGRNEADDADVAILPDAVRTATNAKPTEDTGIANKKYVDDAIDAAALITQAAASIFGPRTNRDTDGAVFVQEQVYLAQCDGFLTACNNYPSSGVTAIYVGSTAGTVTTKIGDATFNLNGTDSSTTVPIRKGEYVKVSTTGAGEPEYIWWVPIGIGGLEKKSL